MARLLSPADMLTIINVILGFLAIIMIISGQTRIAFSFILLALLADGLDGIIARKTKKEGELGEYLEAIADMTSLSIASSVFVYKKYYENIDSSIYFHFQILLYIVLILFLITSAIRLSSFHKLKEKKCFVGLPLSAATLFALLLSFFKIPFIYISIVMAILSFMMISNLRFPKPGLKMNSVAAALIVLTIIMGDTCNGMFPILLLLALTAYTTVGPFLCKSKKQIF
ncbi:MAG: hypothetical protein DRN08_04960 [Thermoplasmata archaeon]|nr:MAG: hypothetical protein DRN05_00845 [Thermoplasmata archaeon]RLF34080.1 MAG: hypothetical protein DRN08_04960 [Thermoplasmata archaeon]